MSPGLPGSSAQTPIWEEPVRGFYTDPGQFVTLSGLDLLRSMLESGPGPPIRYLFGLAPTSVEPGGVTFSMPVTDWLLFPQGVVSGATLGILVDAPPRCAILPRVEVPWEVIEQALKNPPRLREPDWPSPHPYERPVVGEVLAQDIWDRMDGLSVLRSLIAGDLPAPPIAHFCGIVPVEAEAGGTTWKMPASEWLCAPVQGRLYGGAIALLAGTAIDGTVQTTIPAGTALAPVDLKVYFLRPVSPDGRDLRATGTVIHRGRSIAIGTSEVFDSGGKKVAVATGSAVILPGRPATVTTELTLPQPDESEDDGERR